MTSRPLRIKIVYHAFLRALGGIGVDTVDLSVLAKAQALCHRSRSMKYLRTLRIVAGMMLIAVPAGRIHAQTDHAEPALKTEIFESGQLRLADVRALSLEHCLQDLNRRKDYDYSQHCGQPGPDSAYLATWVQCVTQELEHRGYYFDEAGNLHRPGTVVPLR
jgi:hypothetical protein